MLERIGILGVVLAYFIANAIMFAFPSAILAGDKGKHPFDAVVMSILFGIGGLLYYVGTPISEELEEQRQKKQAELIASAIRNGRTKN